jgi:hypothetical protein
MSLELITGVWLLMESASFAFDRVSFFWVANLVGIFLIWGSTFFLQVPIHKKLSENFSESLVRRLVRGNFYRSFLWSARSAALLIWLNL